MIKIIPIIKEYTPESLWNLIRNLFYKFTNFINTIGPSMRSMKYCGIRLYYNKGNVLIKRLKKEIVFERDICEAMVKELKNNQNLTFLDIGANIGLISFYVLSKIPEVKIHAFEPGPNQCELLSKTVQANSLKNITIHDEALGDKVGTVTFHIHEEKYAALDGLQDTQRRGITKPIEVPMITLDSWWLSAHKPKVSVVKIDTEGSELLVLRGAENFIKENKPIIFLEIEPMNLRAYPYNESDIFDFFKIIGYDLKAFNRDTYIARPI